MTKRLIFQVAVGKHRPVYQRCLDSSAEYCKRHGLDHVVLTDPVLKIAPLASKRSENALRLGYLPIYEKENALALLGEYDQIAIIDADVYMRPEAPNIFESISEKAAFSGVVERSAPITPRYQKKIREYCRGQYRSLIDVDWRWNQDGAEFYNMGVMVLTKALLPYLQGQTPEEFLRRKEFERFVNGEGAWKWSTDQTLLNWWVKSSGLPAKRLDWRWNALFGGVYADRIHQAHFVHFFLSRYLPEGGKTLPDIIRRIEAGDTEFPEGRW